MPGYVMHLAEADMILAEIRRKRNLSEQWAEHFLTGNLLPDTRLLTEKKISHFWNPDDLGLIAKAPDLSLFLEKYRPDMDDPVLLGYLTHLHLDARYVHNYWPRCLAFYNSAGQKETVADQVTEVEILKTGLRMPPDTFFSPRYYYGDYGRMNGFFVSRYHIHKPCWKDITDFHMDEVKLEDMEIISRNMDWLMTHCGREEESALKIFDLREFDSFIHETAKVFMQEYLQEI